MASTEHKGSIISNNRTSSSFVKGRGADSSSKQQMLSMVAKGYERETKINEKQFLVSLFFNQEGGGGVDPKAKGKEEDAPYRGLVEASDSILHVPGIMDDWKEDIIR